jgi:hypothetical protein
VALQYINTLKPKNVYVIQYDDMINMKEKVANFMMNVLHKHTPLLKKEVLSILKFESKKSHIDSIYPCDNWKKTNVVKFDVDEKYRDMKIQYNKLLMEVKHKCFV